MKRESRIRRRYALPRQEKAQETQKPDGGSLRLLYYYPSELSFLNTFWVPRRFQWYIAEGMLSLPTAKWSMVISFFSGVMASGFAFGCAKDTVEFFNAGIGEVRFPVGEGFLLVIFDYVGPWV